MRRKFLIVLLVLIVLAGVLVAYTATQPDSFRIERSALINAPPERIFPLINDFDHWLAWSPYERKDPDMQRERSGSLEGEGSVYAWDGDSQVGKGRMEIIASEPPDRVTIRLDFERPMTVRNEVVFTLRPTDEGTEVTWAMSGPNHFIGKLMGLFMDVDAMVGRDFEVGLTALRQMAEGSDLPADEESEAEDPGFGFGSEMRRAVVALRPTLPVRTVEGRL